ncbi:MAG: PDDEXK nuclease domain-containing protein [Acidobacteriota bacterium]|jgi:predicted nuclease of restriction endonuclease-like (RecB) superfamily|nr:PDDEXK nuclease domain-containing protein [Acidobacteriota bacterium]
MSDRNSLGKPGKQVVIPVPPLKSEMDAPYFALRDSIITRIKETRLRFVMQANTGMIELYWNIGNDILRRQESEGWGAKVIDRLSADLKEEFPEMGGFSPRNLKYMRKFAENWADPAIVQQAVAQLQWRSILMLLSKLKKSDERNWYAQKALENGWSSIVLDHMIDMRLIEREGKAVTNFAGTLPPHDSDMVAQTFKDPYLFDFIGTAHMRREAEVERALVDHMEKFLLELGHGFAFVGRQVHLEVGGDDFYIDLLFYHLKLRCYVVVELKARDFKPGDVSQLNMYQNVVNDVLCHPDDKPTIGLLLVKGKNRIVVEYSLAGYTNPIGVADWQNKLTESLPDDMKSSLPTIEEIEREIEYVESQMATIEAANGD